MISNKVAVLIAVGLCAAVSLSAPAWGADDPAPKKPAAKTPEQAAPCPCDHQMMEGCMMGGMGGGMMGGMGGGMMGGLGGGMMGSPRMHMVMALDLTDDQRAKINKLHDELQHKNWERMGLIQDESAKLRDLYEADKRDPKAIGAEYQKIFDLKRQIIEAIVETQNRIEDVLTPDQRAHLKEMRHTMPMHGYPMH